MRAKPSQGQRLRFPDGQTLIRKALEVPGCCHLARRRQSVIGTASRGYPMSSGDVRWQPPLHVPHNADLSRA
jgi:hypothetical protein